MEDGPINFGMIFLIVFFIGPIFIWAVKRIWGDLGIIWKIAKWPIVITVVVYGAYLVATEVLGFESLLGYQFY